MKAPIWIGSTPDVVSFAYKKHALLQPWQILTRIQFRFTIAWCIREGNSLLLKDGSLLPITHVHLSDRALVGADDPYKLGLDYSEDAKTFRAALMARAMEKANEIQPAH